MMYLIFIYFWLNALVGGAYIVYPEKHKSLLSRVLWFIGCLLVGAPVWLGILLYVVAENILLWIDRQLQVRFWFRFFFTRKYLAPSKEEVERLKGIAKKVRYDTTLERKMFMLGIKSLEKRIQ